jgi:hypothetical protein
MTTCLTLCWRLLGNGEALSAQVSLITRGKNTKLTKEKGPMGRIKLIGRKLPLIRPML